MPYISKKELADLREVRRHLTMSNACFSAPPCWLGEQSWPERDKSFTNAVREKTRIWRESWIFPTLDRILKKGEE